MRLVLTGGGTGGHIYPALEVGRCAAERGAELRYFGSLRGQEGAACVARGIPFHGFASEPLTGLGAMIRMQQARAAVRRALRADRPDVVFSTGGYSAGPVVAAARDLGIPYVIHTSDSVPPKSSSMFGEKAFAFTAVFRSTEQFYRKRQVIRTGQPIRREFRKAAALPRQSEPVVLVIGGSQGSEFLNTVMPLAAATGRFGAKVIHATGPNHHEKTCRRLEQARVKTPYETVPYLQTEELLRAYRESTVVVARSGGTLAEFAVFGLPSVLIPLPSSANDHQLQNAREFESMEAATLLWQPNDRRTLASPATPEAVADAIAAWLADAPRRATARHNLAVWDIPDATDRIVDLIGMAANTTRNA